MKVPMRVDYGVRALVELADHYGSRPVQTAEIATRQAIPQAYLDQLLTILHKYGLITSRRGPSGGHMLAKNPSEISLWMVMSTLEGNTPSMDCLIAPNECTLSVCCPQRSIWQTVDEAIQDLLSSTSIADLLDRQHQMAAEGGHEARAQTPAAA